MGTLDGRLSGLALCHDLTKAGAARARVKVDKLAAPPKDDEMPPSQPCSGWHETCSIRPGL